jgi:3-oxoacyl-(acyl-carrier-protein) synthase
MNGNDVVVTGVGMVSTLGASAPDSLRAWSDGRSADKQTLPELKGTCLENARVAGLPEFDPVQRLGDRRMLKYMSEAAMLGCVAAREASEDAKVKTRFQPGRVGLFAGAGLAAAVLRDAEQMIRASVDKEGEFSCRLFGERAIPSTNPLLSFKILANMPACLVSIQENIKGPNFIFTPWEGQTGMAFVEAWRAVAEHEVDCAVAGAADSAASPASLVYLRQAGYLKNEEYPSSGAAYLVLERFETAARDGKRLYARILGMRTECSGNGPCDPLSKRMGRSFAAAPAILLGLACLDHVPLVSIGGTDGYFFEADLEKIT